MALQTQAPRVPVGTTPRLEFQLNNRNNQPVLFMSDAPQALVLAHQNTGTQEFSLLSRGKQPAAIELRFRPGALALKEPVTLLPPETADGTAGWTLTQRTEEDGTSTLALQGPAAGGTLKPGQSLRFVLDKILADARAGSRTIRAQLRWWLSTLGGSAIEGSRQHHLSVSYLDQGTLESRFVSHLDQYKKDQDALDVKLKQQATGPVDSQKLLADVTALQSLVNDLQAQVLDLKKLPAATENPLPLRLYVDGDAAVIVSGASGVKSTTTMMICMRNLEPIGGRPIKFNESSRISFDFGLSEAWGLHASTDSPAFAIDGFGGMDQVVTDGKVVWNYKGSIDIRPSFGLNLKITNLSSTKPPGTAYVKMTYQDLVFDGKPYYGTLWLPIERRNDYHANPTQTFINGDVHVRNNGKLIFNKSAYAPDNKDANQAYILLDGDQLVLKAPGGIRLESDAGSVTLANDEVWVRHREGHELKLTKDWGHLRHSSGREVTVTSDFVRLWHSYYNEVVVRDDEATVRNRSGHDLKLTRDWGRLRNSSGREVAATSDLVRLWHSDNNEVVVRDDLVEARNKSGQGLRLDNTDARLTHSKGHTLKLTPDWCHLRHNSGREVTVADGYVRLLQSLGHEVATHNEGLNLAYKNERAFKFETRDLSGWSTDLG